MSMNGFPRPPLVPLQPQPQQVAVIVLNPDGTVSLNMKAPIPSKVFATMLCQLAAAVIGQIQEARVVVPGGVPQSTPETSGGEDA